MNRELQDARNRARDVFENLRKRLEQAENMLGSHRQASKPSRMQGQS